MTVRCLLTGHRWWRSQTGVRDCARCPAWQWLDDTGRWRRGRDRRLRGLLYHAHTTRIPQRVLTLPGGRMLLIARDRPRVRIRRERR